MTDTTIDLAPELPESDRAAYDAIKDSRIREAVATYWHTDPHPTAEGQALVAHREKMALVARDRDRNAQAAETHAAARLYTTCSAEGGAGPLCDRCRLVAAVIETEAALAAQTADGRDRRAAVAGWLAGVRQAEAERQATFARQAQG